MTERAAPDLRPLAALVAILAVMLSIFQLWQPVVGFIPAGALPFEAVLGLQPATYFRPIHVGWITVLGLLAYPATRAAAQNKFAPSRILDCVGAVLAAWATYRIVDFDYKSIDHLLHGLQTADFIAGAVIVLLTLEVARRAVGWVMMLIGVLFIVYAAYGNLLPDALATRGFSFERIVRFQVFTGAGLYGAPIGIAAGTVFLFVLFGAFLQTTGGGKFFIDLAFAVAGRFRGGPAKASVIASAAMGSISGSAIANTVTTGSLTIPMMKQLGYRPEEAAGIESAASTGGQIMPPIMGAGAFVMAEFTKTAYGDIVWMSLTPALLYFGSTLLYVHLMACKKGLKGMTERDGAWQVMVQGAHFLLPLALITALLLSNYSPVLVGAAGCLAVVAASMLRRHTRIDLSAFLEALKRGALMAVPISAACAVAGLVVGTIGQTGIGLQFTESVIDLADDRLWLALVLVASAALILGMGLPVTAAYIVLAVMAGPALQQMGLTLVAAHMIIFWLSQTSNITPPIALAAFAGAGIAGARPMPSAVAAFKLANGFFVIPLMMAYTPLLLTGDAGWPEVMGATLVTAALIIAVAIAIEGFAFTQTSNAERALCVAAIPLLVLQFDVTHAAGLAVVCVTLGLNGLRFRQLERMTNHG